MDGLFPRDCELGEGKGYGLNMRSEKKGKKRSNCGLMTDSRKLYCTRYLSTTGRPHPLGMHSASNSGTIAAGCTLTRSTAATAPAAVIALVAGVTRLSLWGGRKEKCMGDPFSVTAHQSGNPLGSGPESVILWTFPLYFQPPRIGPVA